MYSIISLIAFLIVIIGGLIQLNFNDEYPEHRRLRAIIGYFVILPFSFLSFVMTFLVIRFFYTIRFKKPLLRLYMTIPSLLLGLYILIGLIMIVFSIFFNDLSN
ncbi:MAG: hypothetical protein EOO43_19615 [Flavobacterium sp.]|nr:MAG: hypothetical protein EOO43_19615 [Flavobacterium sp.]